MSIASKPSSMSTPCEIISHQTKLIGRVIHLSTSHEWWSSTRRVNLYLPYLEDRDDIEYLAITMDVTSFGLDARIGLANVTIGRLDARDFAGHHAHESAVGLRHYKEVRV